MVAFYNPSDIKTIGKSYIVPDTNILALCSSDEQFLGSFTEVFQDNIKMLDPTVKLEFLKGAQTDSLYQKNRQFLQYQELYEMADHFDIYNKMKLDVENISRVYAHHGATKVPLGDVLITARIKYHAADHMLVTLDQQDFTALLFDRIAVVSIESKDIKDRMAQSVLHHVLVLRFNLDKYDACLKKLKQ